VGEAGCVTAVAIPASHPVPLYVYNTFVVSLNHLSKMTGDTGIVVAISCPSSHVIPNLLPSVNPP
jgi:hypothetical protein